MDRYISKWTNGVPLSGGTGSYIETCTCFFSLCAKLNPQEITLQCWILTMKTCFCFISKQ